MTPANDEYPPDQVGEASDLARRFAHDLWLALMVLGCSTLTAAEHPMFAERAASAWGPLCRAMSTLAGLAPNAAARGQGEDERLQDWLEARDLVERQGAGLDPSWRAATFAEGVAEALRRANELGIPRAARVDHLAAAFKAWPALCRAAVHFPELTTRPTRREAA